MEIIFAVDPGPRQRQRLDFIRERASTYFPKPTYKVTFDEYRPGYLTVVVTVTIIPDPPYGSNFGLAIVFDGEHPLQTNWPK